MNKEQIVPMKIFAQRLRERAKQLGISNAEAARRIGLEERRYAHYASGRREPDLGTLKAIAKTLGITPNWLLGVTENIDEEPKKAELIDRLLMAVSEMTLNELQLFVLQSEAISASELNNRIAPSRSRKTGA